MHTKNSDNESGYSGGHASRKSRVNELAKKFEDFASNADENTRRLTPSRLRNTYVKSNSISPISQSELIDEREITSTNSNPDNNRKYSLQPVNETIVIAIPTEDMKKAESCSTTIHESEVIVNNTGGQTEVTVDNEIKKKSDEIDTKRDSDELIRLRNEVNLLKTENQMLKQSMIECQNSLKQLQIDHKSREKLVNEELKNLRKKTIYLLKKSIVLNYSTDEEEPETEDRVIHF